MRETRTKVIGEHEYAVTQLGATAGRKVFTRLAKIFGAGAGAKEPIAGMLAALDDDTVTFLCDTFAPMTTVTIEGRKPQLNTIAEEHFAGRYFEMIEWLVFCAEVNFGSFFQKIGLQSSVSEAVAKVSKSSSLTARTGQSGG